MTPGERRAGRIVLRYGLRPPLRPTRPHPQLRSLHFYPPTLTRGGPKSGGRSDAGDVARKVAYFPVDESLPMLQITIAYLEELMARFRDNLVIRFVLDDFQFIERFQRYVAKEEEAIFGHRPPSSALVVLL
jgi:hypothetical protein